MAAVAAAAPQPMPDLLNIDSRTMYRLRPEEETEEVRGCGAR
jgi:hypothetical protein